MKHGVVMIITCYASPRAEHLKWVKDLPPDMEYVFIRGNLMLEQEYIHTKEIHECVLRCSDTYLGLPEKIKAGLSFVYKTYSPDFVVKIDDDVIVNVPKLCTFVQNTNDDYAGIVAYHKGYLYCGGPLYYLSKHSLSCMKDMDITDIDAEDICIGRCAEQNVISIHYASELYTNEYDERNEYIAFHDNKRIELPDYTSSPQKKIDPPTTKINPIPSKFRLGFLRLK